MYLTREDRLSKRKERRYIHMSFEVIESSESLVIVRIKGELKKSELDQMQELAREVIRQWGRIRVLAILEDFQGWERGEDWGDITFAGEHDNDIEKIGILGDEVGKELVLAFMGKPFRKFPIEYFNPSQLDRARSWIA
jgi:hypothetical protein